MGVRVLELLLVVFVVFVVVIVVGGRGGRGGSVLMKLLLLLVFGAVTFPLVAFGFGSRTGRTSLWNDGRGLDGLTPSGCGEDFPVSVALARLFLPRCWRLGGTVCQC